MNFLIFDYLPLILDFVINLSNKVINFFFNLSWYLKIMFIIELIKFMILINLLD